MPIPTLYLLAFSFGAGASIAARRELRVQPRPALLSRGFFAFTTFVVFVLIPVSVYFYAFHGDWSLLYTVDTTRIPSAIVLLAFAIEAAVATSGFAFGASFVRVQRDWLAAALAAAGVFAALVVVIVGKRRLSVVGSYAQYHGGFGLESFAKHYALLGTIVMGVLLFGAFAYLVVRLVLGPKKTS